MQKQMLSKFPGTCRDCSRRVARGEAIVYHGRGAGISCAKCAGMSDEDADNLPPNEDDAAGFERGTLASDRRLYRAGLSVVRFAGGGVMTQNRRGRCEDAPACGCCTY